MGQADSFHGHLPVNRKLDGQCPVQMVIGDHRPEFEVGPRRVELMGQAQIPVRLSIRDGVSSFSPKFPWLCSALHGNTFC